MADPFTLILRVILGGFFVLAGLLKLRDLDGFAGIAASYRIVPGRADKVVRLMAKILVFVEILAGLSVLIGYYTGFASTVLGLNLVTFITALVYEMWKNPGRPNCGCFGTSLGLELSWKHIIFNVILLSVSITLVLIKFGQPT